MFDPGLKIGEVLSNSELVEKFKCGNMGGMRRSHRTNTLVIVADYTKGLYHDKWIGGVLHYTGMGKIGDQDIHKAQNSTLADCETNGVDVHLFEVMDEGEYIYCGRIELVDRPYVETQPGEDGINRKVWMFPIRPVPDNDVKKPAMFVFSDMDDYKTRGKNVDAEYVKLQEEKKRRGKQKPKPNVSAKPLYKKPEPKPAIEIPPDIIGKKVRHGAFGIGIITGISGTLVEIEFVLAGKKKMGYELCMKKRLLEFIK